MKYLTTPLQSFHKKQDFQSGNSSLDRYLQRQAQQDVRRKLAVCFVLAGEEAQIKGYYTLSNAGIAREEVPPDWQKKLPPSYHHLPVTLLGRLAVAQSFQGKGLGGLLLIDALKRSCFVSQEIGSMAVVVDPIDAAAEKFYEKYGFILLPGSGKMFIPMKSLENL